MLEHRALLEAIRDGDGARASRLMRAHVENFERAMRRVLATEVETAVAAAAVIYQR